MAISSNCAQKSGACIANSLGVARTCYSTSASTIYRSSSNASRSQYRATLCDLLYDDLRPRILHEPPLIVLCEDCTVLQALVVLDASSTPSSSASSASSNADGPRCRCREPHIPRTVPPPGPRRTSTATARRRHLKGTTT